MGKTHFFPLQLKPFLITQCNCTSIDTCSAIKTNKCLGGGVERAYGYAGTIARQNGRSLWLYKQPILDLRLLNNALIKRLFRMITLKQICPDDWFMSLDLKDAYFHIQVAPHPRRFLRFTFQGVANQYKVLRLTCPWLSALLRDAWMRLSPLCDRWEFASSTTSTAGSFWPSQRLFQHHTIHSCSATYVAWGSGLTLPRAHCHPANEYRSWAQLSTPCR